MDDIRTDTDTVRRLQLIGIPADTIPGLIAYVEALNAAQLTQAQTRYPHLFGYETHAHRAPATGTVTDLVEWFDVDPEATGAGKYVQVVTCRRGYGSEGTLAGSVHAVVVKATGQVCKSAGWKKGPAKSTASATKGQVLSHYTLTDPASLDNLLNVVSADPGAVYGGYLYQR